MSKIQSLQSIRADSRLISVLSSKQYRRQRKIVRRQQNITFNLLRLLLSLDTKEIIFVRNCLKIIDQSLFSESLLLQPLSSLNNISNLTQLNNQNEVELNIDFVRTLLQGHTTEQLDILKLSLQNPILARKEFISYSQIRTNRPSYINAILIASAGEKMKLVSLFRYNTVREEILNKTSLVMLVI